MKTIILMIALAFIIERLFLYYREKRLQRFRETLKPGRAVRFRKGEGKETGKIHSLNETSAMVENLDGILYFKLLKDIYPV